MCQWRRWSVRTIVDLIRLSPLLVDEDDGHQDDDLGHDAEERPQSSKATADTQVDLVANCAEFIGSGAKVVSDVFFHVQVVDGQDGLVGGALDLIFVSSAIDDGLLKQQVSVVNRCGDTRHLQLLNLLHFLKLN